MRLQLVHAMHFKVYCIQVRPGVVTTFSSPMPCIGFPCSSHVMQLATLVLFSFFCQVGKIEFAFSAKGSEQLLYPCRVAGSWPLKICGRSHSGITYVAAHPGLPL
jgi:hypothetical protein